MWFTETPWPPILICTAVACLFLAAWHATGRAVHLLAVLGLLVASAVIYGVELSVVTEAERIEEGVYGITSAFQQRDLEKTVSYISPTVPMYQALLAGAMNLVEVSDDLRVTDLTVTMKSAESRGIAHFRANASVALSGHGDMGRHTSRWELTWQREAGEWKIIHIRRLNPITGDEMPPLAQSE